jgi:bleomycin hydrolase
MMTRITFIAGIVFLFAFAITNGQYVFKDDVRIPCTKVKNQQLTGTCWSFGTTSFLESEILRIKKVTVDLSEMYNVRMAYRSKALNYVLRQGKANFGERGLPHDVLNVTSFYGIVPEEAYSGKTGGDTIYNHKELQASLNAYLDAVIKQNVLPCIGWML